MSEPTRRLSSRTFGFGDKDSFFCQVELQPDIEDKFACAEETLSWGSLEMWAGGQNLCAHYEGGALLEKVSWYLLPFFEWVASNWDFILHEQRPPVRFLGETGWESLSETNHPDFFIRWRDSDEVEGENYDWGQRHSLWSCREGGLFPDIVFRRDRDAIEISWGQKPPTGAPTDFKFLSGSGSVRVVPEEVAQALFGVLSEASSTLRTFLPNSSRVKSLSRDVERLIRPANWDVRMAILVGLGKRLPQWKSRWKHLQSKLQGEFASIAEWFIGESTDSLVISGSCEGALMFGSAAPTLKEADVIAIAEKLVEHSKEASKRDKLADHAKEVPMESRPYMEGYRLAMEWAQQTGLWDTEGSIDIRKHLHKFGVSIKEIELGDKSVGGIAVARRNLAPVILVNTSNERNAFPSGERFSLAHELCHLLHDRGRGMTVALISGPWAPPAIEKRANAFAAMLLMPDNAIQNAFSQTGGSLSYPKVRDIVSAAKWLRVSPDALIHHLENRNFIDSSHRAWLELKKMESDQERPPG